MKKEIKLNTIVWTVLVTLIVLSSIFAETHFKYAYILIIAFAIVKFLSISFQFIEVKNAHLIWKITALFFIFIYFIILIAFNVL